MKKLLALLLSVIMMVSLVALPASAGSEAAKDITIENVEQEIEEVETFFETIYNFVHNIVHTLSKMFDFDCPFCDGEIEVPEEPEEIVGTVANADELSAALNAGGTYTVLNNLDVESFVVQAGTKVNFDFAGNTVSGAAIVNEGDLTVKGGSLATEATGIDNKGNATFTDVDVTAGDAGNYAVINREGSYTEYNNVNIVSAGGGIGLTSAKAVFNSGSVEVNSKSTSGRYIFYVVGEGAELVINDGTFSFSENLSKKRAYIWAGSGATVIVNGGNFGAPSTRSDYKAGIMGDGTIIIKGGTFGFDPSAWVAEGYTAVKVGSTWTVVAVA